MKPAEIADRLDVVSRELRAASELVVAPLHALELEAEALALAMRRVPESTAFAGLVASLETRLSDLQRVVGEPSAGARVGAAVRALRESGGGKP